MKSKLRALGLALVAALALTAVMASAVSAQFTSSAEHTIFEGSQKIGTNETFTAGEGFGGITCETSTFSGTALNKSEETQVITPVNENCKDSFGRTVDMDNNKLTYTFTSGGGLGTVHVSGGMTMTVTSGGSVVCTIVSKNPQTNNGVTFNPLGGTKGVEVITHTTNAITTTSGGFFNCGIANGEHKEGTYEGTTIIQGKNTSGELVEISGE